MVFSQKFGRTWPLPESVTRRLLAASRCVKPDLVGQRAVDVHVELRIVEHLLDAQIGDAGNRADAFEQIGGVGVVGLLIVADHLDVDRRRQAEIEDLRDDVGRQEGEGRIRELLRQYGAQLLDEGFRRPVVFLQADQGVAVHRPDRSGVLVGHVDAAIGQADVVDDVVELVGRNRLAHGLLDQVEQARRLLDAGAGLERARASRICPESTDGKKFCPRNGSRPKERMTMTRKPAMNVFGLPSASNRADR